MPSKTFRGRYSSLKPIAHFVAQAAEDAGFDPKGVYSIQLAVDEACSNIIEHGYGGEDRGDINCRYEILASGIRITIEDWGEPFNPAEVPEPDFDVDLYDLKPRGSGLYLIKKLMDEVQFEFQAGQANRLIITKYR